MTPGAASHSQYHTENPSPSSYPRLSSDLDTTDPAPSREADTPEPGPETASSAEELLALAGRRLTQAGVAEHKGANALSRAKGSREDMNLDAFRKLLMITGEALRVAGRAQTMASKALAEGNMSKRTHMGSEIEELDILTEMHKSKKRKYGISDPAFYALVGIVAEKLESDNLTCNSLAQIEKDPESRLLVPLDCRPDSLLHDTQHDWQSGYTQDRTGEEIPRDVLAEDTKDQVSSSSTSTVGSAVKLWLARKLQAEAANADNHVTCDDSGEDSDEADENDDEEIKDDTDKENEKENTHQNVSMGSE